MNPDGPLALVVRIAAILDDLDIPYALGGSVASSFFREPRATADVDIAIRLNAESGESFLERVLAEFYVPTESARNAIHTHQSFNLLAESSGFKADFFVAGDGLLDRRQLERRVLIRPDPLSQLVAQLRWIGDDPPAKLLTPLVARRSSGLCDRVRQRAHDTSARRAKNPVPAAAMPSNMRRAAPARGDVAQGRPAWATSTC